MKLRATPVLLLGLAFVLLLGRVQAKATNPRVYPLAPRSARTPRQLPYRPRPYFIEELDEPLEPEEEHEEHDKDDEEDSSLECEVDRCRRVGKVAKTAFRGFLKVSDLVYKWVPVIKDLLRKPKPPRAESFIIPGELYDCSDEWEYY